MNREKIEYYVAENFWDIPNVNYKMMLQKYGRFEHSGDCTNEAHSCLNCQTEDIKKEAEKLHGFILENFIPKSKILNHVEIDEEKLWHIVMSNWNTSVEDSNWGDSFILDIKGANPIKLKQSKEG